MTQQYGECGSSPRDPSGGTGAGERFSPRDGPLEGSGSTGKKNSTIRHGETPQWIKIPLNSADRCVWQHNRVEPLTQSSDGLEFIVRIQSHLVLGVARSVAEAVRQAMEDHPR